MTPTVCGHHAVVTGRRWSLWLLVRRTVREYYREFTAALRSALHGDHVPLLRIVAENVDSSSYDGAA